MKHAPTFLVNRATRTAAVTLLLGLMLSACEKSPNAESLKADANSALSAHNFSSAAQSAEKWSTKAPNQYEAYFVLAQAKAQVGDKNAALVALEQAIKKGLKDDTQIENNTNLDPIKSMVAYQDLMKSSFPGRKANKQEDIQDGSSVSITEKDGKQVLRAGDIVIQVPSMK